VISRPADGWADHGRVQAAMNLPDPADQLRALAQDSGTDAAAFDVTTSPEGGIAEGLSRAMGHARERAEEPDNRG